MPGICFILKCWNSHFAGEGTVGPFSKHFDFHIPFVSLSYYLVPLSQDYYTHIVFFFLLLVHYSIQTLDDIHMQFNILYYTRILCILCMYYALYLRYFSLPFYYQQQRKALVQTCTPADAMRSISKLNSLLFFHFNLYYVYSFRCIVREWFKWMLIRDSI